MDKDTEQQESLSVKHNISSFGIPINLSAIPLIENSHKSNELQELDVSAYEQSQFEENVFHQVGTAISEAELNFKLNIIKKEIENLEHELRKLQAEKEDIEKVFLVAKSSQDLTTQNISFSLLQKRKGKENKIKNISDKLKETIVKFKEIENAKNQPIDNTDSGLLGSTKAHIDAVRFGEITPFDALKRDRAKDPDHSGHSLVSSVQSVSSNSIDKTDTLKERYVYETSKISGSDKEYVPEVDSSDSNSDGEEVLPTNKIKNNSMKNLKEHKTLKRNKIIDDGNFTSYKERIQKLTVRSRLKEACRNGEVLEEYHESDFSEDTDEEDITIEDQFVLPNKIWKKLYKYQRVGIKWLWQLHSQQAGGIIADEMGLGKTIQIIAFLAGLRYSQKTSSNKRAFELEATLIICPATIMHQWVSEFQKWCPKFRVAILHDSGSFIGKKATLIKAINNHPGVLITSYAGLRLNKVELYRYQWSYVILDEGHKIRNPESHVTIACKHFDTPHRLILTGTPMQNSLKELWSLFDFVFPGKLGTLSVFMAEFSVPITMGGYANASTVQVETAYKCSCVLRDTIGPYILRRLKKDVKICIDLPSKSEQVLFCKLSAEQKDMYQKYINSKDVEQMLTGKMKVFAGLIKLRKICNHPDLAFLEPANMQKSETHPRNILPSNCKEFENGYGYWKRSGKMVVVETLLRMWKEQGHRVLLFTQSRQMLSILQSYVEKNRYKFLSMDGTTNISSRQVMVKTFNEDASIFLFLLTTRVGGLGLNLVGANRVLIYDPDWNPSTDSQARERSWRIGQKRNVTIYRLMTTGTIEEKIYHRQIFKQFLTNRVLTNPFQRRFFKSNDLYELFTLGDIGPMQSTETGAIFAGTGSEIKVRQKSKKNKNKESVNLTPSNTLPNKSVKNFKSENGFSSHKTSTSSSSRITKFLSAIPEESGSTDLCLNSTNRYTSNPISKNTSSVKRKRKRKRVEIDGHVVDSVDKSEPYDNKHSDTNDDVKEKQSEKDVLLSLFRTSGIHSALKHDRIEQSSNPDYVLVEKEAERVAKRAVEALRKSREEYKNGTAKEINCSFATRNANKKPRFGKAINTTKRASSSNVSGPENINNLSNNIDVSSTALLARMKKRQFSFTSLNDNGLNDKNVEKDNSLTDSFDEAIFLRDIQSFMVFHSKKQSTTDELIAVFQNRVPREKNALFKEMLRQICYFDRDINGEGVWKLKDDFT